MAMQNRNGFPTLFEPANELVFIHCILEFWSRSYTTDRPQSKRIRYVAGFRERHPAIAHHIKNKNTTE
jgi:hypothetical protein